MEAGKDLKHLMTIFEETKSREIKKLELIQNPIRKDSAIPSLKGVNTIFFVKSAFLDGDFVKSKEYLFKIAIVDAYFHEKLGGEIFNTLDTFTYPVLSDNENVITRYLNYTRTEHEESFSTSFGRSIQALLLNDSVSLKKNILTLDKWSSSGWAKSFRGVVTSLKGFLNESTAEIEKGLSEILQSHHLQEHSSVLKPYINLEATVLAKIAFKKNLAVSTNHELIPTELINSDAIGNYQGYSFFEELSWYQKN